MSDLRLSLTPRITTRDGTLAKDSLMENFFREESEGKAEAVKRPGLGAFQTCPTPGTGQGTFTLGQFSYAIARNTIFMVGGGTTFAIPAAGSFDLVYDAIPDVTFGSQQITILKTTVGLWYFNGITVTKVVDVDYPATTVRGIVLVDGTFYVMTLNGTIHGSGLEDPTVWTALNFIGTDQSLGIGMRLFRHLNYCFAFSNLGLQAFYNNGNPPPGSPLSPAGNATYLIGCANGDSVVGLDDLAIFISKSKQRGRSVSALQGLSLVQISTPWVDKILNRSTLSDIRAFGIRIAGHSFYVLTLPDLNVTLACDLVAKDWAVWSSTVSGTKSAFRFANYLNTGTFDVLQEVTTGNLFWMSPDFYQDAGQPITCRIVTVPYDGQTSIWKFFTAANLIGDEVSSSVSVRYSDDDYQTWSTYRTVSMLSDRKQIRNLGRSRRRSFELLHTATTPLRLEGIDFELYLGNT